MYYHELIFQTQLLRRGWPAYGYCALLVKTTIWGTSEALDMEKLNSFQDPPFKTLTASMPSSISA